jgi:hypothetical protein
MHDSVIPGLLLQEKQGTFCLGLLGIIGIGLGTWGGFD